MIMPLQIFHRGNDFLIRGPIERRHFYRNVDTVIEKNTTIGARDHQNLVNAIDDFNRAKRQLI